MRILLAIFSLLIFQNRINAQILVDETWGSASTHAGLSSFNSGRELKDTRKMGLGTTLAGATGLLGLNLELNFTKDFSFAMGVGVSRGFQSFNINMKQSLGGSSFLPYFVGGYSRWFSHGREGGVERTSPPVLGDRFLSPREKRTGEFAKNIIYPGLGLQYINASGDFTGLGFFAEVLFLVDIDDFLAGTTAGLGTTYYF